MLKGWGHGTTEQVFGRGAGASRANGVEHERAHDSQWSATSSTAAKIGGSPATLRKSVRQSERSDLAPELLRVWRGEGMATAQARADRLSSLRGAATDARHEPARRGSPP